MIKITIINLNGFVNSVVISLPNHPISPIMINLDANNTYKYTCAFICDKLATILTSALGVNGKHNNINMGITPCLSIK